MGERCHHRLVKSHVFHKDPSDISFLHRPQRWSIFRAMRCRWFIFQDRYNTNYVWEKLNIAIVAIIFLDHRERLFFDYFAHFRTDYFGIIHDLPPNFLERWKTMKNQPGTTKNHPGTMKNHETDLEQCKTDLEPWKSNLEPWKKHGNLLLSPKRYGLGGQYHRRCD